MLIESFLKHVEDTTEFGDVPPNKKLEIAVMGLVSEIGSVVSAVKKGMLHENGPLGSDSVKAELKAELGDVFWYAIATAQLGTELNGGNIVTANVLDLEEVLSGNRSNSDLILRELNEAAKISFIKNTEQFMSNENASLDEYQELAALTRRTEAGTLLSVCLAVLLKISAQLMRPYMPQKERQIHADVEDRPTEQLLADVAWYVATIADLQGLSLSQVAAYNIEKATFRLNDNIPTPRHDLSYPESESFPDTITFKFATDSDGRASITWLEGDKVIGDPLTDNAHGDDGYRFHDVLHLANIAHLGWSPVLRGFMGLKRRSNKTTDRVEDGARARLLEEVIVLYIRSEGARQLHFGDSDTSVDGLELFSDLQNIDFSILKRSRELSYGYEPYHNKAWEWRNAIRDGHHLMHKLHMNGGGTVTVDMNNRKMTYVSP